MNTKTASSRCGQCKSWVPSGTEICETCQKESSGSIGTIALRKVSSLFSCQCAEDEKHGCVIVWSGGAVEQLEAMVMDLAAKANRAAKDEATQA
jgi:hypothetical protein